MLVYVDGACTCTHNWRSWSFPASYTGEEFIVTNTVPLVCGSKYIGFRGQRSSCSGFDFEPKKFGSEIFLLTQKKLGRKFMVLYELSVFCCCFVSSLLTADNKTEFVVGWGDVRLPHRKVFVSLTERCSSPVQEGDVRLPHRKVFISHT